MRRMLDPNKVGLPSTITFDEAGNRKASKDVEVDGKLKLKSLVSDTNPDGDITKELGGGGGPTAPARHGYSIFIYNSFHYEVYTTKDYDWEIGKYTRITDFKSNNNYSELRYAGDYPASGFWYENANSIKQIVSKFEIITKNDCYISGYDFAQESSSRYKMPSSSLDDVYVVKLY